MIYLVKCLILQRKVNKKVSFAIIFIEKKGDFSIMVIHMTFNHSEIGSIPIDPILN